MAAIRVIYGIAIAVLIVVALAVAWAARYPAMPTISEAESFDPALVAHGAMLAGAGDCAVCHTAEGGQAYAGGRAVPTPFGTIYATNITPDPETGIGAWSEAAFRRAMHEGVDREGNYLYPAFPYNHFTKVSDGDIKAIYAFLMTRAPVKFDAPADKVAIPRIAVAGWNLLFLSRQRFTPDQSQSEAWNRGAYLVEGLGHCGSCHTPKNVLGAERGNRFFAGDHAEGWDAPALNKSSPAPAAWTADSLAMYLADGHASLHGKAAGPMAEVIRGLSLMPADDIKAVATYVISFLPAGASDDTPADKNALADALKVSYGPTHATNSDKAGEEPGAAIFASACATCHHAGGGLPATRPVPLALSTAVHLNDPTNVVHVVLEGIAPEVGTPGRIMPPFGDALTNQQVADVVSYVRKHFTNEPAWSDVANAVERVRAKGPTGAGKDSAMAEGQAQ